MLNQEQGVRGILSISNDLLFAKAVRDRSEFEWEVLIEEGGTTANSDVTEAINSLSKHPLSTTLTELAIGLSTFDWRSANAPNLDEDAKLTKRAFRGSGGYVALRDQIAKHLATEGKGEIAELAAAWRKVNSV